MQVPQPLFVRRLSDAAPPQADDFYWDDEEMRFVSRSDECDLQDEKEFLKRDRSVSRDELKREKLQQ